MATAAPFIGLAIAAIGTGVSVYSGIQQGKAQSAQAEYQSAVMKNNAIYAERAAKDAEARGKIAEDQQRMQTQQLIGRQRALLAANGVMVDTGSAADLTADTAMIGEQEALTVRNNAQREANGYRQQGANFDSQAYIAQQNSGMNWMGVGGTALSGIGSVADKWYNYDRLGAFDSTSTPSSPSYTYTGTKNSVTGMLGGI